MKLPDNIDAVCIAATQTWGHAEQEAVAIGELGELLTLFGRRKQKRDSVEQWRDEICDGIIMMRQLAYINSFVSMDEGVRIWQDEINSYQGEYASQEALEIGLLAEVGKLLGLFEQRLMKNTNSSMWYCCAIRITAYLYVLAESYSLLHVECRLQEKVDKLEARVAKYMPQAQA